MNDCRNPRARNPVHVDGVLVLMAWMIVWFGCETGVLGQGILDSWRPSMLSDQGPCPDCGWGNCAEIGQMLDGMSSSSGQCGPGGCGPQQGAVPADVIQQDHMRSAGGTAAVKAGWHEAPQIRTVTTKGMLGEIESRVPASYGRQYLPNKVLWAHEATHKLNCDISNNVSGQTVFFVGGGKCFVLKDLPSSVTLSKVARRVEADRTIPKGMIYQNYLVRLRSANDWFALIVVDELVAFINDLVVGIETKADRNNMLRSLDVADKFYAYSMHLGRVVEASEYPREDLYKLGEFLDWCRVRLDNISDRMEER